jgi:hypothetical protein
LVMTKTFDWICVVALVVGGAGCPAEDDSLGDSGAGTTAGTAGTTTPMTTTMNVDDGLDDADQGPLDDQGDQSDQGDDVVDDTADTMPPDDTGPGTTGDTTGDGGTTMGGGGTCEPDPDDDACDECVKMSCCDQLMDCEADPGCMCWLDCSAKNPGMAGAFACGTDCGVDLFAGPTGAFVQCAGLGPCAEQCNA